MRTALQLILLLSLILGAEAAFAVGKDTLVDISGVAVVVEGMHECMTTRGVRTPDVSMVTSTMLGAFREDASTRREFLAFIGK